MCSQLLVHDYQHVMLSVESLVQIKGPAQLCQPGSGPGAECGERQIIAFSLGSSGHGAARWAGSMGTDWGLCPAELQSHGHGHPVARFWPWSSSEPLSHPHRCDLMLTVVTMGHSPWRPQQLEITGTSIKVATSPGVNPFKFQNLVQLRSVVISTRWSEVRVR